MGGFARKRICAAGEQRFRYYITCADENKKISFPLCSLNVLCACMYAAERPSSIRRDGITPVCSFARVKQITEKKNIRFDFGSVDSRSEFHSRVCR